MPKRRLYLLLAASLAGILILLSLGLWQLERLAWKRALLADLARAVSADAPFLTLSEAEQRMRREPSADYLRVRVEGTFDHSGERYLFAVLSRKMGWHVITPFTANYGRIVLVDRGFVPESLKDSHDRRDSLIAGKTEVLGLLRKARKPGLFTPSNDPQRNSWYWLDVSAIFASLQSLPPTDRSEFVVEALPSRAKSPWPKPTPPNPATIPNNHLQYALTWFALACILALMSFFFVRQDARRNQHHDSL